MIELLNNFEVLNIYGSINVFNTFGLFPIVHYLTGWIHKLVLASLNAKGWKEALHIYIFLPQLLQVPVLWPTGME